MKIIELRAKNVMRLSAVTIHPDGSLVVIGGNNAAGKTSVLNAIAFALGGKKLMPAKPLRAGQKRGHVKVDLGDLVVTRTFTSEGGGTLKVESADGQAHGSPQKMLDALVGRLSFDPLDFSRMPPSDQLMTLKRLVGLDFDELDQRRMQIYESRRMLNRDLGQESTRLTDLPAYPDAPKEEVSIEAISVELEAANAIEKQFLEAGHEKENWIRERVRLEIEMNERQQAIEQMEKQLEQLRATNERQKTTILEADARIQGITAGLEELQTSMPNRDEIKERLAGAQETNRQVAANQARREQASEVKALRDDVAELTEKIEEIDDEKRQALAKAEFPVEGLGFGDAGITFQDIPFEQASSAEQLRVSVAMGLAMNPTLKVLLIRDGSLLDQDSLALIAEMADVNDAQIWIERVGQDKKTSVVIEDGAIRAGEAA